MAMRHSDPLVELGVNKLLELGVLTEPGLQALGRIVSSLQAFGANPPSGSGSAAAPRVVGTTAVVRPVRRRWSKLQVSKEELERLYIKENKSLDKIAEQFGVSRVTVLARAKEFGLSKRPGRKPKAATATPSSTTPKTAGKTKKKAKKARKARRKTAKRKTTKKTAAE